MIRAASSDKFYCVCCPVKSGRSPEYSGGNSWHNLWHHMGSKNHWKHFRERVFKMPYSEVAWQTYTAGNKHGCNLIL